VKKLGPNKHMFGWRFEKNKTIGKAAPIRANFLDTATLAKALLSPPSVSLEYLTSKDCLDTTPKKISRDDHIRAHHSGLGCRLMTKLRAD
jgi:hypothetical protein